MVPDAINLTTIRRALVIKLRHHGDVLLTSPVFKVLKNHAPHVEIDALVYKDTQEMLQLHPAINNVFTIDRAWKSMARLPRFRQERALLRSLRRREYDFVIHLTEHARGAWLTRLLQPRYSVAGDYHYKRGRLWRSCFSHIYKLTPTPRHTVEHHLDALRRVGIIPQDDERGLVLVPGQEAERSVAALLTENKLKPKGYIHCHPTSRWMFKSWQPEKFADVIAALTKSGERVVLTAAPAEPELEFIEHILAARKIDVVNLCGKLSLKQLAALTAQAKCFVGVDSVPMHIAAAVQTPVVVLFGPSGDINWAPWRVRHELITSDQHPCRPCGLDGCGGSKVSDCLTSIPADTVLAAINRLLQSS